MLKSKVEDILHSELLNYFKSFLTSSIPGSTEIAIDLLKTLNYNFSITEKIPKIKSVFYYERFLYYYENKGNKIEIDTLETKELVELMNYCKVAIIEWHRVDGTQLVNDSWAWLKLGKSYLAAYYSLKE